LSKRPAVFIDRDGTLNEVVFNSEGMEDSPFCTEDLKLLPGAGEFTRRLREAGYLAVLATNQPGVAKGSVTIEGLEKIHRRLLELLAVDGGGLDRLCYCPHHPVGKAGFASPFIQPCDCRKPGAGMLLTSAKEMDIDLSRSWMVGDKWLDVKAGQGAGCRTVLLARPTPELGRPDPPPQPDYSAANLLDALDYILSHPANS